MALVTGSSSGVGFRIAERLAKGGNCVALTLTSDTPTMDKLFAGGGFQQDLFAKVTGRFPMGRPPAAEEVAAVTAFLASEDAAQVTGQTISVNGGLSFGGW